MSNFADKLIDSSGRLIRIGIRQVAKFLNRVSSGKLKPNTVTVIGLLAHLPIAWLIATGNNISAAILLIIFGLFDTLDGELARLQQRDSVLGMLLDATTDRFKEVMLYSAVAYRFIHIGHPYWAVWAIVALGSSLCVSYIKAKAEAASADLGHDAKSLNHLFKNGLMRFEVRMLVIIVGLLLNRLSWAIFLIAVLATFTAIQRLVTASKKLDVQN